MLNYQRVEPPTSPGCCMPSCSRPSLRPSCRCQGSRPPVLPRHQKIHNSREHLDVLLESHLDLLPDLKMSWIPGWIVCRTAETPGRHSSGTVRSHLPLSSPRPAQGRSTWRRVLDLWKIWIPPLHLSEMNPWKTNKFDLKTVSDYPVMKKHEKLLLCRKLRSRYPSSWTCIEIGYSKTGWFHKRKYPKISRNIFGSSSFTHIYIYPRIPSANNTSSHPPENLKFTIGSVHFKGQKFGGGYNSLGPPCIIVYPSIIHIRIS